MVPLRTKPKENLKAGKTVDDLWHSEKIETAVSGGKQTIFAARKN